MNVFLDPSRTVRCVAPASGAADELASTLRERVDDVVSTVDRDKEPAWLDSDDWGCLVVHDGIGKERVLELCERVRAARSDVPVVVVVASGAESLVTAVGVEQCTPLVDPGPGELRTAVADRLEQYVRLRTNAEEREILTTMLERLETPLYAKDTAGRHLRLADVRGGLDPDEEALDRISEMIDDTSTVASHRGTEEGSATTFALGELVETLWAHMSTGDATLRVELPDDYLVHAEKAELRPLVETLLRDAVEGVSVDGSGGEPSAPRETGDLTVTVGLTDDLGFSVATDASAGSFREDDGDRTGSRVDWGLVDNVAQRNDWHVEAVEQPGGGSQVEVRNCLGAVDRSPPDTLGSIELSETATVGALQQPGRVEYDPAADEWTVAGDGEDIWRQYNDFKFAYARVDGPVRIQGHVADVEHVHEFSKGGLMVRDDLDPDATYGFAGTTPTRGSELLCRTTSGADGTSQQLAAEPFPVEWYRLDRVGDRITAWLSTDGQSWHTVHERRIDVSDPVYVGLAVSSVVPGVVAEATFRGVGVERLDV